MIQIKENKTVSKQPIPASLTINHGWLSIGQKGTVMPNASQVEVQNEDCTGLMVPDYFFKPQQCGYEFGVRAGQVFLSERQ